MPWLILSDFNSVKSSAEKQLGVPPTWYELKDFADCCLALGLHDAQTTGCYYTWYSNSDSNPIWCKLDQILLNNDWLEAGLHCRDHFNLLGCLSDHSLSGPRRRILPCKMHRLTLNIIRGMRQFGTHWGLRKKVIFLAEAERHFYYQKTEIHFLKQGDRNIKFFYDMVKRNATRNSILAITKSDGTIITSTPDIAQEFINFYTSLLGIEHQTRLVDNGVFHWGPSLTSELASDLCRAVTPTEIKIVVFQISDNKAPDPDGYTSFFFKKTWNIVGDLVCRAVMDFFRSGRMLRQLNHTIIALVPKSGHSPSVAD
ncbi:UNVERIFIED_CONTAM: hypothetical protein Sangu_0514000 [Sesamum angustifolium]|uniref:Uncharacterized protein n=1 Tax=Sesamum angustifolium TaxID=2727405 RepID=A0AAW2Q8G0_9LAMI